MSNRRGHNILFSPVECGTIARELFILRVIPDQAPEVTSRVFLCPLPCRSDAALSTAHGVAPPLSDSSSDDDYGKSAETMVDEAREAGKT